MRGPLNEGLRAPAKVAVGNVAKADLLLQRDAAAQALDYLQRGILVTDAATRVLFSSRTADKILRSADGLYLRPEGLSTSRPEETADLRGLVRYAASSNADADTPGVMGVWRPSLKRMLLLRITPLHVQLGPLDPIIHRAAVFVHDPATPTLIDEAALSRLYGLTRAESHLVVLLLKGVNVQQASAALGVSLNTVRTHLKHIFVKTDTNRQTQLVSLLLGSVIQVPDIG